MLSTHDALYRAVCADPDEDTPRLAFADLVEEDGDPARAAFIRAQVELARLPAYDPVWAKCRQAEPELIRGWAMAHTLPKPLPDGFSWRDYRFRRGFPWRVLALSAEAFAARAAALFATAPIRALSFDDRTRPSLAVLAAAPALARLHRLEFNLTRFDAADLAPLAASPHAANLTALQFDHHAVTPEGLEALARSPLFARLTTLELKANVIPPALLVDALAAAGDDTALRTLALPFAELPRYDAAHLFALPVVQRLTHLDLTDNPRLGPKGVEYLAESGAVRGLEVLKLGKTLPGVPGVRALTQTSALAGVRWLDLSANRLGPTAAGLLAESRNARGLRVLDLSDNPVGGTGAAALAGSPHLAGLVELDLEDCGVGDAGALALAASPHLDGLLRLDLRDRVAARPLGAAARRALVERFGGRASYNRE